MRTVGRVLGVAAAGLLAGQVWGITSVPGTNTPTFPMPGPTNTPTFDTPGTNTPTYDTPTYALPGPTNTPTYDTPGTNTPTYDIPTFALPGPTNTPGFDTPGTNTPTFDTPTYALPGPTNTPTYTTPGIVPTPSVGGPAPLSTGPSEPGALAMFMTRWGTAMTRITLAQVDEPGDAEGGSMVETGGVRGIVDDDERVGGGEVGAAVPEPGTASLLVLGLAGLMVRRRADRQ